MPFSPEKSLVSPEESLDSASLEIRAPEPVPIRSTERMHRIVAAARALANETGSAGFTVADIAKGAGLSLKSVYRCFAGKDEILLALLEEESRTGAVILESKVAVHAEPTERIRAFVEEIFSLLTHEAADGYARVLAREQGRLFLECPDELSLSLAPLVDLLASYIDEADLFDSPADVQRAADTVFSITLRGLVEVSLGRVDPHECGRWVWEFCAGGLGVGGSPSAPSDPNARSIHA